jgi:hypothetical protein
MQSLLYTHHIKNVKNKAEKKARGRGAFWFVGGRL